MIGGPPKTPQSPRKTNKTEDEASDKTESAGARQSIEELLGEVPPEVVAELNDTDKSTTAHCEVYKAWFKDLSDNIHNRSTEGRRDLAALSKLYLFVADTLAGAVRYQSAVYMLEGLVEDVLEVPSDDTGASEDMLALVDKYALREKLDEYRSKIEEKDKRG